MRLGPLIFTESSRGHSCGTPWPQEGTDMLKRSGSLALTIIVLVSLAAGSAYAQCPKKAKCLCGTAAPKSLSFTTSLGSGNCGSVVNSSGASLLALGCNNLYTGGGGANVPPITVPDAGETITKVSCCNGRLLTLAAAPSPD